MADNEKLLSMLDTYGQQFMSSFDPTILSTKRKEAPEAGSSSSKKKLKVKETSPVEDDEEWTGFLCSETSEEGECEFEAEFEGRRGANQPAVVVFSDAVTSAPHTGSKAQLKAFMSSKVARVTQESFINTSKQKNGDEDEDEDLTNAQNDALLHKLVHTKLLSGSLDPALDMTPAQRRKALAGRVLEAAGKAKLGKGETAVRAKERNKAAKHVRDGLVAKQKERGQKQLEVAKHMGNYHPALKQLFEDGTEPKQKQKRERGLKMGVGTFSGGVLKLSKQEIATASEQSQRAGIQRKGSKGKRR